jgi:ankyrin repeat protein
LLRAIASGDKAKAIRLLERSPQLAVESVQVGATRENAKAHYLEAIGHYVFANDTALHIAAGAYAADVARELIVRGASPCARNRLGAEPLHYAAVGTPGSQHWDPAAQAAVVEVLIGAGADPNSADKGGVAPLHRAVRTRCAAAVRVLLAHGADPRAKTRSGSMPLHLAVQNTGRGGSGTGDARQQQVEIIRLLVSHGARRTDKDGRGKTVKDRIHLEARRLT